MAMKDFAVCVGLILCSVLPLARGNEYYLLTSPKFLRFGVKETLSVSYHGNTQLTLTILLRYGRKEFSVQQVTLNHETPQILDVQVTRDDLGLDVKASVKPRFVDLVVKSRLARYSGEDKMQMLISYNTGYLFIQTDKPIYSPGFATETKVFIRVMALDENFKPSVGKNVTVEITDPRGVLMTKNTKDFVDFIREEMVLDSLAAKGIWTVRAKFEDELETEAYAFFEVKEYVIPTFEVIITNVSHRYISNSLDYLSIIIKSIYVYGKPIRGTCSLRLKLKDTDGNETDLMPYFIPKQLDSNGQVKITIDVKTILRSVLPGYDIWGKRLVLDATVQETTTGNTQTVRDQSVFFSNNPYVLKFFRSSSSFQPDLPYKLHIDVFHLAGDPAADINLQVQIDGKNETIKTDENGQAVYSLNTKKSSSELLFQIKPYESRNIITHIVKKYDGKHYLQLTVTQKQPMHLEARTDSGAKGSGGLVILTSSRGRLYDSAFFPIGGIKTHNMSPWQHQMISSGRSIGYFIQEGGEVVADQIKYDMQRTCLNRELTVTLKDHKVEYYPGHNIDLTVTGVNNSRVGLGVIDRAVLLVSNRSNLFERSQMFDKIEAHDRGCTYGGGMNGPTVFRDAGMVVLTNARLIMESNTNLKCPASTNQRRKRNTDEDLEVCCMEGKDYANSTEEMTACVHEVLKKHKERKKSSACLNKFLECCRDVFPEGRSSGADKIVFDFDQTAKDLKIQPRDQFEESWLFDELSIGSNGELHMKRPTPHSITEWRVQAIGMSSEYGICIAEPVTFKTFKNFFLQVDLPYKAVRLEQMNIKVTIFNYDANDYWVNVYIEPWDTAICASTKMGVRSEAIRVLVKANEAHTVIYPILPLEARDTYLTVYGVTYGDKPGMNIYDAVKKKLHIVNEGIEENERIQLCLDPHQERKTICTYNRRVTVENDVVNKKQIFTVNLTMPDNAIQDTGKCVIYLTGNNIMDIVVQNTIKDVDKLFAEALPRHCGEQTMVRLAPTVYAMVYLDKTKQMINGSEIERNGFNLIKKGIMQMKKYKKSNGAYSLWTDTTASTWLTAYVLKVYCQTDKLHDTLKQEEDIWPGLEWLVKNRQNADGSFTEDSPVYHRYEDSKHKSFLTAYALITLQECKSSDMVYVMVNDGIKKAMKYVERTYRNIDDMYVLAIAAYALAISKSPHRTDANNRLKILSRTPGQDFRYWSFENEANANPSATTIETTCYALLTQLEFDDLQYARDIVNWLAANINSHGSFKSTQDTVVCLQALSSYNIRTFNPILDLHVTVLADGYSQTRFVSQTKTIATPLKNIPVGKMIIVDVTGKGDGHMFIDFVYNRKKEQNDVCNFSIEISSSTIFQDKASKIRNSGCDICGVCPNENTTEEAHNRFGQSASITSIKYCITVNVSYIPKTEEEENAGMSIVDIGIQTGFKLANDQDLKDMVDQKIINHFEMPGDTRYSLILYVNTIPKKPDVLTFKFTVTKEIEVVNNIQPAAVTVYQYDDPDKNCIKFYSLMEGSSGEISSSCQGRICECLEGTCPKCYEEENGIIKGINKRPFAFMKDTACDQSKADYIFHVNISKIRYEGRQKKADAKLIKVIKRGAQLYDGGKEISFTWESICQCPRMKENKQYVIIAKDGPQEMYKNHTYLLRDFAIVWDDSVRLRNNKVSSFLNDIFIKNSCGV